MESTPAAQPQSQPQAQPQPQAQQPQPQQYVPYMQPPMHPYPYHPHHGHHHHHHHQHGYHPQQQQHPMDSGYRGGRGPRGPRPEGERPQRRTQVIGEAAERRSNRIQVSLKAKSPFFYGNLAKRFLMNEKEVELSALGFAITTVVSTADILTKSGACTITKIETDTVEVKDERSDHNSQKAKISITVVRGPEYERLMKEREAMLAERGEAHEEEMQGDGEDAA